MEAFFSEINEFVYLGIALLLGLIIGAQRGWVDREQEAGQRIAGIRTHMLIALLGGISALLSQLFSPIILAVAFFALAIVMTAAYINLQKTQQNKSITTLIGVLITFSLGALSCLGKPALAASAAVLTAIILDNKKGIHAALQKLEEKELQAALKLLLISVVLLPLLPNERMGPWNAINPYEAWWMVVLIATISFVGYFAIKIGGAEKGILFTSLFAGLSSSTALTLHYSKLSKNYPHLSPLLASGILVACGAMFPRIFFVCLILNKDLAGLLLVPLLVVTVATYIPALFIWRLRRRAVVKDSVAQIQNPLELSSAVIFGAILLAIMLLSHLFEYWIGDAGVLLLAGISGITDVDAITLTLSRWSSDELPMQTALYGILIAASMNSLVKSAMSVVLGSRALAIRVCVPLLIAVALGLCVVYLQHGWVI